MYCNKCSKSSLCGCKPKNCGCAVKTQDQCVTVTVDLECSSIERGRTLDQVLLEMDNYLCDLLSLIQNAGAINIVNVGTGAKVFKGINPTGSREFRSITSSTLTVTEDTNTINLEAPNAFGLTSVGTGEVIYKGLNGAGVGEIKSITSDTLSIDGSGDTLIINQPMMEGILQYIVNNKYTGAEEEGSLLKPFKSIENALTKFQGTGTPNTPQNPGATIVVQKGNPYTFTGDFSYRNLNVVLEEGVIVNHTPATGGWLLDYDSLSDARAEFTLNVKTGASLRMNQKGFRNRGSTGGSSGRKVIDISGSGELRLVGAKAAGYVMFEANYDNQAGYHMPNYQNFIVKGVLLYAPAKDIYNVGRDSETIFDSCNVRHSDVGATIDPTSEVFDQVGGGVTFNNCILSINGTRDRCFTLSKTPAQKSKLILDFCKLLYPGTIGTFFFKKTTEDPDLECQYMSTTENINLTNIFEKTFSATVWKNILFRYNIFSGGSITKSVDLTNNNRRSTSNLLGGKNIDSLVMCPNRTDAKNPPWNLETGAKFINTNEGSADETTWKLDIIM